MAGPRQYVLEYAPEVRGEVREAARWYRRQAPQAAKRFVLAVRATIRRLSESPLLWSEIEPGLRRVLVDRFPYLVIYQVRERTVRVANVVHQSRDPGLWRVRGPGGG